MRPTLSARNLDLMMMEESPRPVTTLVAAVLMVVVCIPFLKNGFDLVQLASDPTAADEELQRALIVSGLSGGPREVKTFAVVGAGMMLGLSLLALTLAAGVFRRREGAHHATIVVFAILGLIALAASSQGLFADPPAEGAKVGLAVGLANVGIVGLLLTNSSRDDVERMESIRARRKYERQDARAARRAARLP